MRVNTELWKSKLTPQQLENKRRCDREKQRRKRLDRKRSVTHLQSQFDLLLSRNESDAVRALVEENETLRTEMTGLKATLQQIVNLTADLEHDSGSHTAAPHNESDDSATQISEPDRPLASLQRSRGFLSRCSIPRQVAEIATSRHNFGQLFSSIDSHVDGFLIWKLLQGHKIGLSFMLDAPEDGMLPLTRSLRKAR